MAYTSGRTVKSPVKKTNPFTEATRVAARLARKHLPASCRPTVMTDRAYGSDLTERARTTITFPDLDHAQTKALADAIAALPRYHSMVWGYNSITFLTDLEG